MSNQPLIYCSSCRRKVKAPAGRNVFYKDGGKWVETCTSCDPPEEEDRTMIQIDEKARPLFNEFKNLSKLLGNLGHFLGNPGERHSKEDVEEFKEGLLNFQLLLSGLTMDVSSYIESRRKEDVTDVPPRIGIPPHIEEALNEEDGTYRP